MDLILFQCDGRDLQYHRNQLLVEGEGRYGMHGCFTSVLLFLFWEVIALVLSWLSVSMFREFFSLQFPPSPSHF